MKNRFPRHSARTVGSPTRSLSPYAYCANNPVNNVDLDGKKIRFAKGVPSEFKQQFSTAIKILNEHNIGGIFAKLEQRPEIIFITEGKNQFDPSNNTISWNPTEGMITDILNFLSPVVFLNHEGAHGLRYLEDPEGIMKDKHTEDSQYGNKEEKRVIEGVEQKTAEALGEVEPGEPTRINHFGTPIIVGSPNSTEPKSSPEIIYKMETK